MSLDDVRAFAQLLRGSRRAAALTQEALAERARVSVETISNLERGVHHAPRPDTLDLLADALGLVDAEQRRRFYEAAQASARAAEPDAASSQRAATDGRLHIPMPPTPLIGREREVGELGALLHARTQAPPADVTPRAGAGARLLTLVGPPGVGKTRLAIEVARAHAGSFRDGTWFVALAPISTPELVLPTLAHTLGLREDGAQPLPERLLDHLRTEQTLIVLDNFEHLLAAAPILADLLAACPDVALMVTSRAPVGIRGEQQYPLAPLPLPDPDQLPPLADLAQFPSVALFAACARAVQPHFSLSARNAADVAAICCRLDGLPLAIELAAARIKLLSTRVLLTQLDHRLAILTDGPADLAPHQRTLRATLDWSYALLPPEAQSLFRRLAVFAGGASLDAIAPVCDGEQPDTGCEGAPRETTVLDMLGMLVKNGLAQLREDRTGASRVWLLQTVREYALDQLAARGELAEAQRRFALYYVGVLREAMPSLRIPDQSTCVWLDEEHDNLTATLQWVVEHGEVEDGLLMGEALWYYWDVAGRLSEGSYWLERLIALGRTRREGTHDPIWIPVLRGAGVLANNRGAYSQARALLEESLCCARAANDRKAVVAVLNNLAAVECSCGDFARAATQAEAALDLCRTLGDLPLLRRSLVTLGGIAALRSDFIRSSQAYEELLRLPRDDSDPLPLAYALSNLGWAANIQGQYARAVELLEEALTIFRTVRHIAGVTLALDNLGDARRYQADYATAARHYDECLTLCQQISETRRAAGSLLNLGHISREQGNLDDAEQRYAQSAQIFERIGARLRHAEALVYLGHAIARRGEAARAEAHYQQALRILRALSASWELAACLEGFAVASVSSGQPARAARLSAAAAALRDRLGMPPPPSDLAMVEQTVARARAALTKREFAAAWARGQAMPLEAAIADALDEGAVAPLPDATPEMVQLRVHPQTEVHNGSGG